MKPQKTFFYILVRSRNSFQFFDRCIDSILDQNYKDYSIIYVDDHSNYTTKQKKHIEQKLVNHIVIFNKKRKYSLKNAYEAIHKYAKKEKSIVVSLDGDDWLYKEKTLQILNDIYQKQNCVATYGDCYLWKDGKLSKKPASKSLEYCNIPYPQEVIDTQSFRKYPFLPLHLRTWKTKVFKNIPISEFKDHRNNWFKFCEDQAIFYPILEMYKEKVKCVDLPLSVYNMDNVNSDMKINTFKQIKNEIYIRKKFFNIINNKSERKIVYSKLMSVPFFSDLIYYFQLVFFDHINTFVVSAKMNINRDKLFSKISEIDKISLETYRLGIQLRLFHNLKNIILDLPSKSLKDMSIKDLRDLNWTIILSQKITKECYIKISKIIE